MRRAHAALVMAALAAVTTAIPIGAQAQTNSPSITIERPTAGESVPAGTVEFRGRVSSGAAAPVATVLYVVDVSGSTASPTGNDCNGDGKPTEDDFNADGQAGDTLDCEISAVVALNGSLRAVPGSSQHIRVGLIPFGSSAAVAD